MAQSGETFATLEAWIDREVIPFDIDRPTTLDRAIDALVAALGADVQLLGFGEVLHGGEEILLLRNRLFQRLATAHGYSAIAFESSVTRGRLIDDYVGGRGSADAAAVMDAGFSHGFGRVDANRELIEWMRAYNADPAHPTKLRFYGADSPTEMTGTDSPRQALTFALDFLAGIDGERVRERRERITALLGPDATWEDPAAPMDPARGIGLSPDAMALRVETEDLIAELKIHRPALIAASDRDRYLEALQHARVARQLLTYHAVVARESERRVSDLSGIRDAMIADNLTYAVTRERGRGKVLVFAHNRHLQRDGIAWQLGSHAVRWWPAGAHLREILGPRYWAIGTGLGVSAANGIDQAEPGTLEGLLLREQDHGVLIPTHGGDHLPAATIDALPHRSDSAKNRSFMPLGPESFTDFDWLAIVPSATYWRGGWSLPD